MRLSYLAAAGPQGALDRLCARLAPKQEFGTALRPRGWALWVVPETPVLVSDDRTSAAVGLLFEASSGRRLDRLPSPLPGAERWVERVWGAYVLFAADGGGGHRVLRDPSGSVPAYHHRSGAIDLYASDLALLGVAAPEPPEPSVAFLQQWLTFPHLRGALTGVCGVTEIVPGTARRADRDETVTETCWSPWTFVRDRAPITDLSAAAALLREAVLQVTPRLAAEARDPVVKLSGGLDSSIVAAALAAAGRPVRAVNFATRTRDGDERPYARAVARRWGFALDELVEEPDGAEFEHVPAVALRPLPNALLRALDRTFANHLALTGADLLLDGTGGDNVFGYLATAAPAVDAFRTNGLAAGIAASTDIAHLYGTTLWAVARAALRRARRPVGQWPREEAFLSAAALATEPQCHPWLEAAPGALPGAAERLQSLVGIRHFIADRSAGSVTTLHPLLAQPVLETCLRMPSWLWLRGGRDRAVARAAFGDLLPDSVAARRSKGNLGSLYVRGYMAHRAALERLLLDGRLAQLGLLDRDAVRAYLRREEPPPDAAYIRLLDLSSAETWLRAFDR